MRFQAALILAPSSIVSTLGFGCLAACSSALLFSWKAYELLPLATYDQLHPPPQLAFQGDLSDRSLVICSSVQPGEIGEITEDDAAQIR